MFIKGTQLIFKNTPIARFILNEFPLKCTFPERLINEDCIFLVISTQESSAVSSFYLD
jgi:hypothetical protein